MRRALDQNDISVENVVHSRGYTATIRP